MAVVVDQVPDLQDNGRRVEAAVGLRATSGLLVDVQQRGPLCGDADAHGVVQSQPGQWPGQLGQRRGDVAAQLEGGLVVVVDIGGHFVDVDQRASRIRIPQPADRIRPGRSRPSPTHRHGRSRCRRVGCGTVRRARRTGLPVRATPHRQPETSRQPADRRPRSARAAPHTVGLADANADEEDWALRRPNQVDGLR